MSQVRLSIIRCRNHPMLLALEVSAVGDPESCGGGVRIAGSKCCGIWDLKKSWLVDAVELVNEIECMADAGEGRTT